MQNVKCKEMEGAFCARKLKVFETNKNKMKPAEEMDFSSAGFLCVKLGFGFFDSLRGPTFSISGKSRQKRRQKPMVFEFPFRDYAVDKMN